MLPINRTRAMVLSAGVGKRLRPITATTPKPLVDVAGRALIDQALDRLTDSGVETAVVNVHYLADLIIAHLQRRARPKIVISDERARLLETGGGVKNALPFLGAAPFLVCNADSTWIEGITPNLAHLAAAWDPNRMDLLLLIAETVKSVGYSDRGDFILDPHGRLQRRAERCVSPFVYAGTAVLKPELFDNTPDGPFSLNLLFDRAIEAKRAYGVLMEGLWLHVGTPEGLRAAERAVRESAG